MRLRRGWIAGSFLYAAVVASVVGRDDVAHPVLFLIAAAVVIIVTTTVCTRLLRRRS